MKKYLENVSRDIEIIKIKKIDGIRGECLFK